MAKKCDFKKSNGGQCGADAQTGKVLCVFHDPARSADGRRARRAGGVNRSRLPVVLPVDTPDHSLASPNDVANLLAQSINQLRRGELDLRIANGIGYLSSVLLRALEQGPMEERLAHLEAALGTNSSGSDVFAFRSGREIAHEQPSAASEGD